MNLLKLLTQSAPAAVGRLRSPFILCVLRKHPCPAAAPLLAGRGPLTNPPTNTRAHFLLALPRTLFLLPRGHHSPQGGASFLPQPSDPSLKVGWGPQNLSCEP